MLKSENQNRNSCPPPSRVSSDSNTSSICASERLSQETSQERANSPLDPSEHKFLFKSISPKTIEYYESLNKRLYSIINVLEDSLLPVDIREDCCSIKKKPAVFLRLPDRRKTEPARVTK
jgi:hypothetical protein